jgi:hypothetical protein
MQPFYLVLPFNIGRLVLSRGETVGRWEGSYSSVKLCTKLSCHSFTGGVCKDRFYTS